MKVAPPCGEREFAFPRVFKVYSSRYWYIGLWRGFSWEFEFFLRLDCAVGIGILRWSVVQFLQGSWG